MERTITAIFKRNDKIEQGGVTFQTVDEFKQLPKGAVLLGIKYGYTRCESECKQCDEMGLKLTANHCHNCNKYIPSGWQTLCRNCYADLNYKN